MTTPIVVGIDESRYSAAALDWAMREAELHRLDLRLIHALLWYPAGVQAEAKPRSMVAEDAAVARRLLDTGLARARTMIGGEGLAVSGHIAARTPATALLEAAAHAVMVVVGRRGSAGITGRLLGSVSLAVAARAVCPVVVVPQPDPSATATASGPVMLGVDVRHPVGDAIAFAFEEAAARRSRLHVVYAQRRFGLPPLHEDRADADRLAETLAPWQDKHPAIELTSEILDRSPAQALVDRSGRAVLTVLGAGKRPVLGGLGLGLVSHAVLHHGFGPIAIVPDTSR